MKASGDHAPPAGLPIPPGMENEDAPSTGVRLTIAAATEDEGGKPRRLLNGARSKRAAFTVRFGVSVMILMAAIVLPLSSTLLWLGWRAVDAQEQGNVQERMEALHFAVAEFMAVGVRLVVSAVEALADTSDFASTAGHARDADRRQALIALLMHHRNLAAAFAGYPDGHFVYVSRVAFFTSGERKEMHVPDEATFLFRDIDDEGGTRREKWWFDAVRPNRQAVFSRPSDYDPRTRPWYVEALQRRGPALTDPYRFAWHTEAGVSAGVPIEGGGVIGVDLNLDTLAQLLNEYKITHNSIIGVATDVADVVIESEPCAQKDAGCFAEDSRARDILQKMAQEATGDDYRLERTLDVNGRDYKFIVQAAPPIYGKSMMIAAAVPVTELSAASMVLLERAALAGAVAVVIAIIGVFGVSFVLSRPMGKLTAKTERIRNLDFSDRVPVRSRITEILRLSEAIERMRSGLEVFGLYVSKELVDEIMRSPGGTGLGGTRRQLTVMFTDIEGFSRISETMEPELLTDRLSRYFDALGTAISANRGMIDKYIGDGMMAFWNAPQADPDHIFHACTAALGVSAASAALATKWQLLGRPAFHTRIGLHTGEAVVGNVGARQRINYTLVGAVANQASRLEAMNKVYGTRILASGEVAAATQGRFIWRHIDRTVPSGTTEILDIYELMGEQGDADAFSAFLRAWQSARAQYDAGEFSDALAAFEDALALRPDDGPCHAYIKRCRALCDVEKPVGWDGIWRFERK